MSKMLDDKRYSSGDSRHYLLQDPKQGSNNAANIQNQNNSEEKLTTDQRNSETNDQEDIARHRMTYMKLD